MSVGSVDGVLRARVAAQGLDGSPAGSADEVVRGLLAVQSQDVEPSMWSVAMRCGASMDDVFDAFDEGRFLRTHVLRPTWHHVHPDDLRWLQALTAPRVHVRNGHRYRELGLGPATLERGDRAIAAALEGGARLTRPELGEALEAAGIADATGQRLAHLVMHAELEQVVCSGPRRGRQHTYALLDDLVPSTAGLDEDDALGRLATRFVAGHGPAGTADLAAWASLTRAQAATAVEAAGEALTAVEVAGKVLYHHTGAPPTPVPGPPEPRAHLLQPYDEYVSGFGDTRDWSDPHDQLREHGRRFLSDVLLDGRLQGTWRRTLSAREVTVQISLPPGLDEEEGAAVVHACERYAAAAGRELVLADETRP